MLDWIRDMTDFIFLSDAPRQADVIFVPGNGHPEPSEHAARLYRQGLANTIIPSGRFAIGRECFAGQISGSRTYAGTFETEADFMRAVLMENGVPEDAILCEREATYTYQNAIFSRKLTDARGIAVRRAIICCMPVHARRSRMYYETLFPEAELFVCPTPEGDVTADNWTKSETGIDTVLGEMERCGGQFHQILREILIKKGS